MKGVTQGHGFPFGFRLIGFRVSGFLLKYDSKVVVYWYWPQVAINVTFCFTRALV